MLAGERYLALTTFRRSGAPVATPVWFALRDGPSAVVHTEAASGKVRRLRDDPRCTVAACDARGRVHGPEVAATGAVITSAPAAESARRALARTYGWQWRAFQLLHGVRRRLGRGGETVALELRPRATTQPDSGSPTGPV